MGKIFWVLRSSIQLRFAGVGGIGGIVDLEEDGQQGPDWHFGDFTAFKVWPVNYLFPQK